MPTATRRRTLACEHGGPSPLRGYAVRVSMPYEATVPVHRRLLWPAVTDAERLIGALPNASVDASGAQGVAGRLRVRTREQTVTFRGVARIVEVVPSSLRVSLEVEAVFGRAGGTVEGTVEITLRQSGSGTRVVVGGQLDIATGTSSLSAEALDGAFQRVVQRWFTALAATSPAQSPSPQLASPERPGRPDGSAQQPGQSERPPREAEAHEEPRDGRPTQRAPLAVVRDVSDQAGQGSANTASPTQLPRDDAPEPQGTNERNAQRGQESADETRAEAKPAQPPALAPLRLVATAPEPGDSGDEPSLPPEAPRAGLVPTTGPEPVGPEETEDIWSRLRDRSVPPWIPFLIGAVTAALGTFAFALAALRRRYRR
ncbi:hypothetical protein KGA66_03720 [Actinocrinis puniceicyclus]|uniref:Carbon monoxide dehydrogenase subunit G n=1 Tax=Actinocrinis puniceicyclus TaxID=977794 RepID=A0A8J7WHB3_9ACTN|nr:hypothetical protein [Actinocrinis puniceicyclus]MBS2962141.1 hypothetical protein [Actinocrinis puniceicyclus]